MPTELEIRMGLAGEEAKSETGNDQTQQSTEDNKETAAADQAPEGATSAAAEIDEDAIALAAYNKRKGTSFKSWDELDAATATPAPTESEEEKKKRREKEKFKFGIENNIITPTTYEGFVRDSTRNPRELVFENFQKERREAGDSDATIERKFKALYGEDLSEDDDDYDKVSSFVKDRRQKDLQREAARLIKKQYPDIVGLDSKFSAYETEQQTQQQKQKETEKLAATYRQDVDAVFSSLKSRKVSFTTNDEPFETDFTYKPEVLNQIKQEYLKSETFQAFTANYSKEAVQKAILLSLNAATEDDRTAHVAKSYHAKQLEKKKITRNALVDDTISGSANVRRPAGKMDELYGIAEN